MPPTKPRAPVTSHGVDLVDENDAGGVRLPLFEEVSYPAGPDTDEHLDEVGSRHGEERPPRLPCHCLGQQRLAGSGRAHQQGALRQAAPQAGELLGILQEFDDLLQFHLGLVGPSDIGKSGLRGIAGE